MAFVCHFILNIWSFFLQSSTTPIIFVDKKPFQCYPGKHFKHERHIYLVVYNILYCKPGLLMRQNVLINLTSISLHIRPNFPCLSTSNHVLLRSKCLPFERRALLFHFHFYHKQVVIFGCLPSVWEVEGGGWEWLLGTQRLRTTTQHSTHQLCCACSE